MNYEVIMERGNYALILRGENLKEYAVVSGLNKECGDWDFTCVNYPFLYNGAPVSERSQAEALAGAVNSFRIRTESDYISRDRLEELATLFKDGLIEDGDGAVEATKYFDTVCDMTESEKKFFGIGTGSED